MQTRKKSAYERIRRARVHAKRVICSNKVSDEKHTGDHYIQSRRLHLPVYEARVTSNQPETEDHMFFIWCERSSTRSTHHLSFSPQFYLLKKRRPKKIEALKRKSSHIFFTCTTFLARRALCEFAWDECTQWTGRRTSPLRLFPSANKRQITIRQKNSKNMGKESLITAAAAAACRTLRWETDKNRSKRPIYTRENGLRAQYNHNVSVHIARHRAGQQKLNRKYGRYAHLFTFCK